MGKLSVRLMMDFGKADRELALQRIDHAARAAIARIANDMKRLECLDINVTE